MQGKNLSLEKIEFMKSKYKIRKLTNYNAENSKSDYVLDKVEYFLVCNVNVYAIFDFLFVYISASTIKCWFSSIFQQRPWSMQLYYFKFVDGYLLANSKLNMTWMT